LKDVMVAHERLKEGFEKKKEEMQMDIEGEKVSGSILVVVMVVIVVVVVVMIMICSTVACCDDHLLRRL